MIGELRVLDIKEYLQEGEREDIESFLGVSLSSDEVVVFISSMGDVYPVLEDVVDVALGDIPLVRSVRDPRRPVHCLTIESDIDALLPLLDSSVGGLSFETVYLSDLDGLFFFHDREWDIKIVYWSRAFSAGESLILRKAVFFRRMDLEKLLEKKESYYQSVKNDSSVSVGYVTLPVMKGKKRSFIKINPNEFKEGNFYTGHFDFSGIVEDVVEFLVRDDERRYLESGMPKKKGVIFHGPPGTGKSKMMRYLAYSCWKEGIGVAWLNSAELIKGGLKFSEIFMEISKNHSKKLVMIEDAEPLFSHVADSLLDSELLQIFDGLDQGVLHNTVIIISVNSLEKIPHPFRRPGRFDRVYKFPKLRRSDIVELLGIDPGVDGLTMAEVRELRILIEDKGRKEGLEEFKLIRKYYSGSRSVGF